MLKGIIGNRLLARTGKKMVLVHNREELIENYKSLEDPDRPNLMLQEGIPGDDDQVWIFNGYFDEKSECLNPYTGHKVRQFPVHVGCASLGICKWNEEVANTTMNFMKALGYRGILDIGYRLDPRDGKYKVLDINPRIGQAFRIFVAENNSDVARDLYLDLSGQKREKTTPCELRQWVIEDFDFISSVDYYYEGTLTIRQWWKSFKGLQEGAWWYIRDPWPFTFMAAALIKRQLKRVLIRFGILRDDEK
jgi:predicted ATP-grasp superfamily ATP-dependent carboligase